MSTHLVTGSNGFLGSFIIKELIAKGENVIGIDLTNNQNDFQNFKFFKIDILDKKKINEILKGVDYVHHTAALVPLKKAGKKFWETNVLGTKIIVEASKINKIKHFSHISSSAVFGNVEKKDCPIGIDPKHLHPIEVYGKSKKEGEDIIKKEIENKDSSTTFSILRPRTVIGSERLGIFEVLFEWVSEGKNIFIIGDGSNLFQFVHIQDISDVSILSCYRNKSDIYNVGSENFSTLEDALNNLIKFAKTKSKIKKLPIGLSISLLRLLDILKLSPLGPWHYLTYHKDFYYDLSNTCQKLKWNSKYSNDEMLKESYSWYIENKDYLSENKSLHRSKLKKGILKIVKLFA